MKKRLLTKLQESETKLEETVARASLLEKNKHRLEQEMEDLAIEVDRCVDWCECFSSLGCCHWLESANQNIYHVYQNTTNSIIRKINYNVITYI